MKTIKPKKKITIKKYGKRLIYPDNAERNKILDIIEEYLIAQCEQIKEVIHENNKTIS